MPEFVRSVVLPFPAEEVYGWHLRPGAFERLIPPWEDLRPPSRLEGIGEGSLVMFTLHRGPVRLGWEARHRDFIEARQFVDEQVRGPFPSWVHKHGFRETGEGACEVEDRIEYELPFGPVGRLLGGAMLRRDLARLFAFRHRRTAQDLARHGRFAAPGRRRIALTGSAGLVGGSLRAYLSGAGHEVLPVVRRGAGPGEIAWNPAAGTLDAGRLEGLDGLVHLAGENISSSRWTAQAKARIRASRVDGTRLLCEGLAKLERPPRVLVSASAVGWYGDRGDDPVDETAPPGRGFLPEVCAGWEEATEIAREAGIRVVNLRIGVVLAAKGGALARMLTPFKLGMGGPVGDGRQVMSWIALDDLLGVIEAALWDSRLSGPVNATSPNPVTQAEFARTLGAVLRRPVVAPLPAGVVRLVFGEMGQTLLLEGARVLPSRLMDSGFPFLTPDLEGALRAELGR
jgi:uncharacterized protein (TIGR01777 family)